jgi:hypothetical protein
MKVLSTSDDPYKFLKSLRLGETFGFSQAFLQGEVLRIANRCGLLVSPPAKTTPERKQYGDYVLKVRSICAPQETHPKRLSFRDVAYITETSKAPRKCKSRSHGPTPIPAGSVCVIESVADRLPDGKRITKHTCFCAVCGVRRLKLIQKDVQVFIDSVVRDFVVSNEE